MTIIKLITKHPVLHPHPVREVYLNRGALEMEANWFGVAIRFTGQAPQHPVVVPWSNVAEVVVDDAEEFMADVIAPAPPVWMPKVTEPGDSLERAAASDPPKKTRSKK